MSAHKMLGNIVPSLQLLNLLPLVILTLAMSQPQSSQPPQSPCSSPITCQSPQYSQSSCPQFCSQCANKTTCLGCIPGFALNNTNNSCYLQDSCQQVYCTQCVSGICTACVSGYYLGTGNYLCLECGQGCVGCSAHGKCQECMQGYFINQQGLCQSCITNCQICNDSITCISCSSGYFVNQESLCSVCSQPCKQCQNSSTTCIECKPPMNLDNNTCISCQTIIPNCLICNSSSPSCLQCVPGYYLQPPTTCLKCPLHCLQCTQIQCLTCTPTFYYNSTYNSCLECPTSDCLKCLNGTCIQCIMGTYYSGTVNKCLRCSYGCDICLNEYLCFGCYEEFYLVGGLCYPCSAECNHCVSSPKNCTVCVEGYYKVGVMGLCLPCPLYCATCTSPQNCLTCPASFYVLNGTCLSCSEENCLNCATEASDTCILCKNEYYLVNSTCQPCTSYCKICNNSQTCITCKKGAALSPNKTCMPCTQLCNNCRILNNTLVCLSCIPTYYLSATQTCDPCPYPCIQCTSPQNCKECVPGHYLPQLNSSIGQVCELCLPPCKTCYSYENQCTSCILGYELRDMFNCVACGFGCLVCGGEGVAVTGCHLCRGGFVKVRNYSIMSQSYYCQQCPTNCLFCFYLYITNPQSLICSKCVPGFTLSNNNTCFLCGSTPSTTGCLTCNNKMLCATCVTGLELNNQGQCVTPVIYTTNYGLRTLYICLIVLFSVGSMGVLGRFGYDWWRGRDEMREARIDRVDSGAASENFIE